MSEWLDIETALTLKTMLVGAVANSTCAVLGVYLVLQRMSLLGDAISHAVLPGIVLGFLLTGQLGGPGVVLGAAALGVLTAWLTAAVRDLGKLPEDAGLGVVFTTLFALGVVMISIAAVGNVHLDAECVFFGQLEFIPLAMGDSWWPPAGLLMALGLVLASVVVLWKELKLACFDPALATALGFSAVGLHYWLMGLVAGVAVASFQAVGSVLVVAMLIVPAATAQYLSDRLVGMILASVAVAILSAVVGCGLAVWWEATAAAMMAVVAGGLFALAVVFAPNTGLLSRAIRRLRLRVRVAAEDLLTALYRYEEAPAGPPPTRKQLSAHARRATGWLSTLIAAIYMQRRGLIHREGDAWKLEPVGRLLAGRVLRAHRLWESYLQRNFDLPLDHLHEAAHQMEHFLGPHLVEQLDSGLDRPAQDPHGRSIPE